MRVVMAIFWVLLVLIIGLLAYIRLAPSDLARFHIVPQVAESKDLMGGVKRRVQTGPDGLQRLQNAALTTPRTQILAGTVAEGHITFVSRTKWVGFPDFTSAKQDGDDLLIYARQRFGRKDFGVNKARVDGWLSAIGN